MNSYNISELGDKVTITKAQYIAKAHSVSKQVLANVDLTLGLDFFADVLINELMKELFKDEADHANDIQNNGNDYLKMMEKRMEQLGALVEKHIGKVDRYLLAERQINIIENTKGEK